MRILGKIVAGVALVFILFTAPSMADIISLKIRSHNRDLILFSKFEFSHTGYVSVALSSVGISSIPLASNLSQPDPSRLGFFLLSEDLSHRYDMEFIRNPDLCALDIKFITVLFTFRDLSTPPHSFLNKSYRVTYPGEYSVYFANCNDLSQVAMDVRTELYNTDDDGTTKDYLSAGQSQPSVFVRLYFIYVCFFGFWGYIFVKNRQCFQMIHLLMGVLIVMALVHFFCAVADQQDLKVTGTRHRWHVLVYIVQFMRNVLFFTIILLIGAGRCFWKPLLTGWDILILTIVVLLQVWANIICILVGESGPYNKDWPAMIDKFRFTDFMCCLVVFVYTLYSAKMFYEATDTSKLNKASGLWYTARPAVFTVLLLFYFYHSRGMNIPLEMTMPLETANLVFTMLMFLMYGPYIIIGEDENCVGFLDQTGV